MAPVQGLHVVLNSVRQRRPGDTHSARPHGSGVGPARTGLLRALHRRTRGPRASQGGGGGGRPRARRGAPDWGALSRPPPPAGPGRHGRSRAQAPPRGQAASATHPGRQLEASPTHGGEGTARGLRGPWSPHRPSPAVRGLGHAPAIVGSVADHAPQQGRLVHQFLGDAADVHAGAAKAPPGAWGWGELG